jgi:cytidylate kinase
MRVNEEHDVGLARVVERQMRNWELARQQRAGLEPMKRKDVEEFICLSRESGVGAYRIGTLLAKRTGWPVFEKEILHVMAGDNSVRERVYQSMDERDLGWWEEMLRSFMDRGFKTDYTHELRKNILALARQGSAIFIGRGADLILPRNRGLRVRLVAPLEWRVTQLAERRGLTSADAVKEVQHIDTERAAFIRKHFHVDDRDPIRYDLVINLQRYSVDQVVDLIDATRLVLAGEVVK